MSMEEIIMIPLLIFVIGCALAVALTRDLLTAAVVFMGQSLAMSLIWLLLESPDLGITEAAVGAGIDSLLLFVTLKKIHAIDGSIRHTEQKKEGGVSDGTASEGL